MLGCTPGMMHWAAMPLWHLPKAWLCTQIGRVVEAEEAFRKGMALRGDGASNSHALRSIAEMRRGCGRHLEATEILDLERIKPSLEAFVELVFVRGASGTDWSAVAKSQCKPQCRPLVPYIHIEIQSFLVLLRAMLTLTL